MSYKPVPNPEAWTQADWYVDWVAGDDARDGKTPATAVRTVMGGVVGRWGTNAPQLGQTTTLHILTPQAAGAEEIALEPTLLGQVNFVILGTPALSFSTALGAVTPKDRATNQQFAAAGLGAAAAGQLVHNTTAGKDSWCFVRTAGAPAELTQPLAPLVPGVSTLYFPTPAEVDTWALADTVDVYDACALNLRSLVVHGGGASDGASTVPGAWLDKIKVLDASGAPGTSVFAPDCVGGAYFIAQDCVLEPYFSNWGSNAFFHGLLSCLLNGGNVDNAYLLGGVVTTFGLITARINWLDADVIIDASSGFSGEVALGVVNFGNTVAGHGGAELRLVNDNGYGAFLWGVGTLNMQAGGGFWNTSGTTWALSVSLATLQLLGAATGTSYAAGVFTDGIALTPANLDAHAGGLQSPAGGARYTA